MAGHPGEESPLFTIGRARLCEGAQAAGVYVEMLTYEDWKKTFRYPESIYKELPRSMGTTKQEQTRSALLPKKGPV